MIGARYQNNRVVTIAAHPFCRFGRVADGVESLTADIDATIEFLRLARHNVFQGFGLTSGWTPVINRRAPFFSSSSL